MNDPETETEWNDPPTISGDADSAETDTSGTTAVAVFGCIIFAVIGIIYGEFSFAAIAVVMLGVIGATAALADVVRAVMRGMP